MHLSAGVSQTVIDRAHVAGTTNRMWQVVDQQQTLGDSELVVYECGQGDLWN